MLTAEDVAYWFFRLNGCLTIRNFLLHPDPGEDGLRTDADLIAVRFPFREELGMRDHPLFASLRATTMMFVEIKSSRFCRLNGPWTAPRKRNLHRALSAMGPFDAQAVDSVAAQLYASGGALGGPIDVWMIAIATERNPTLRKTHQLAIQLTWDEVLQFLHTRLLDYSRQKKDHDQWEVSGKRLYELAVERAGGFPDFRDEVERESGIRGTIRPKGRGKGKTSHRGAPGHRLQ